jgi:hypothetical protein
METFESVESTPSQLPAAMTDQWTRRMESAYDWDDEELSGWDPKQGFLWFYRASRQSGVRSSTSAAGKLVAIRPFGGEILVYTPDGYVARRRLELELPASRSKALVPSVAPPEQTSLPRVPLRLNDPDALQTPLPWGGPSSGPERVAGSELWRGLRRLLVGGLLGMSLALSGVMLAILGFVVWPVSALVIVMGLGLLLSFVAFAADIRRTAQSRYFMIVGPAEQPEPR